jgi:hypothetical protein
MIMSRASIARRKKFLAYLGKIFPSAKAITTMTIPKKVPINPFTCFYSATPEIYPRLLLLPQHNIKATNQQTQTMTARFFIILLLFLTLCGS